MTDADDLRLWNSSHEMRTEMDLPPPLAPPPSPLDADDPRRRGPS